MLALTIIVGITMSLTVVKAAGMGGPNTGDYVYEDQEYITNAQYDKLADINDNIFSGVSPQRLYVLIFNNTSDVNYFNGVNDISDIMSKSRRIDSTIVGKTGEALYGSSHYFDLESDTDENESLDIDNNYLIMDLQNNKVYLNPSLQGSLYLTDLMFWQAQIGLASKLRSKNTDTKVAALFQLAGKLEPKLKTVSENKKMLKSTDYYDVQQVVDTILMVLGVIIVIIVWIIIHRINKNKPHHGGGGSDLGNSDYDEGFDEGYYMGSNDPFM
ncbi:hypothetical protein IV57_GL000631 [Companilactobacillus kimchiensis]|uniref:TPM domain-containing protein n=2 Tax=Companilactobacillus kimchiensis TaxID=993692 RepID=A0A0R2LBL2_9LACO|nr:hypothetical protein IV57_GL000631 [Companilactobacillus kimchiensis]